MDERRYARLVGDFEVEAARNPGVHRFKAVAVSAFAYLVLVLLLVLLVAIALKVAANMQGAYGPLDSVGLLLLVLLALPILLLVSRMLTLRLTPTDGTEITVADAPKLFKLLRHVRKRLNGPPIHRVIINPGFGAAIEQLPRFGFFGAYRNHLVIGLPMAFALSGRELAGVIAHEYGHLADRHDKLSGWIYRQRRTFGALMEHSAKGMEDGWVSHLLHFLLKAFAPYHNAVTFVTSRRNEYEADADAARIVGQPRFVSGMIRITLVDRWLAECFWPKIYSQANLREQPLFMPYSAMPTAFRAGRRQWLNARWLNDAWNGESGLIDTHPCLRQRAEAQGGFCKLPGRVRQPAAEVLLGPLARELASRFDSHWWNAERIAWRRHFKEMQDKLAAIDEDDTVRLPIAPLLHA